MAHGRLIRAVKQIMYMGCGEVHVAMGGESVVAGWLSEP